MPDGIDLSIIVLEGLDTYTGRGSLADSTVLVIRMKILQILLPRVDLA